MMGKTYGLRGALHYVKRHPLLTVLYGGAAALLVLALLIFIQTGRTWSWMAVGGEVEDVVTRVVGENRSGHYGIRYGEALFVSDSTRVLYRYTVYDVEYQGLGWHEKAGQLAPGVPVKVYYNPSNPQQSVLMREVFWAPIMTLTFLAAVMLFGARRWQRFRRTLSA